MKNPISLSLTTPFSPPCEGGDEEVAIIPPQAERGLVKGLIMDLQNRIKLPNIAVKFIFIIPAMKNIHLS
jgi:hypothetical protein